MIFPKFRKQITFGSKNFRIFGIKEPLNFWELSWPKNLLFEFFFDTIKEPTIFHESNGKELAILQKVKWGWIMETLKYWFWIWSMPTNQLNFLALFYYLIVNTNCVLSKLKEEILICLEIMQLLEIYFIDKINFPWAHVTI